MIHMGTDVDIKDRIRSSLIENGASAVGFADLSGLPLDCRRSMNGAVSIIAALDPKAVLTITDKPTAEYYNEYVRINALLSKLGSIAASILIEEGYAAIPLSVTDADIDPKDLSTKLPHKTAATLSGIGWIGRSALLVTKEFGSAVRLTTVLTDLESKDATPVGGSLCGDCIECVEACPGRAVKGVSWVSGMKREDMYDAFACRKAAREQAQKINVNNTICGICIAVCPWTRKYLKNSGTMI
jgi:epoxyqueuosine reductase